MIRDKRIAFAVYVVLFIVFWNIADLLWKSLVSGTPYEFSGTIDITVPLTIAIVTGYLLFLAKQVNINDELAEARSADGSVIVDVRGSVEYAQGHIPGAVNIPADNIGAIKDIVKDKDAPVFTYCLRGSRSRGAARTIRSMGYKRVIDMGGINKYKGELER